MKNPIFAQINKLRQIVSASETLNTYTQAIVLTWTILKETGILLWLILCLVIVGFDWFWTQSIAAGQRFRLWLNQFQATDSDQIAAHMGQEILTVSKASLDYTIAQAREQIGLSARLSPVAINPPSVTPVAEETTPVAEVSETES
jgi:hypothetical protein